MAGSRWTRSGRVRQVSLPNPNTAKRIIVGEWANATAIPQNAVVGGFDIHGRFFYRITRQDMQGNDVPCRTATATNFNDVIFRHPYSNLTHNQVRLAVYRDLNLPAFQRP
jgi:hypothetical protein